MIGGKRERDTSLSTAAPTRLIRRCDVKLVGSNKPCEDRYSIRARGRDMMQAFAVIDGHGGNLAADLTCTHLLDMILDSVITLPKDNKTHKRSPDDISKAIDESFVTCDTYVLQEALRIKEDREKAGISQQSQSSLSQLSQNSHPHSNSSAINGTQGNTKKALKPTGRAGCCALVLLLVDGYMFFAHAGDCRAVMASHYLERKVHLSTSNSSDGSDKTGNTVFSGTVQSSKSSTDTQGDDPSPPKLQRVEGKEDNEGIKSMTAIHNDDDGDQTGTDIDDKNGKEGQTVYHNPGFYITDYFLEGHALGRTSNNSDSTTSSSNGDTNGHDKHENHEGSRQRFDNRKNPFRHIINNVEVYGITNDHTCDDSDETEAIARTNADANPIRSSINDKRLSGINAPKRVAGSLAVTRAMGDGYLKRKDLSVRPYIEHCPYITCRPTINYRSIHETDIAVILASDGLWNFVTAKDCANVLSKITENHHHSNRTSPSKEEAYNDQKNSIPLEYKYDSHIPPDEMAIKEGQAYQPREGAQQGLLWDSKMSPMADKDGQDGNDSGDKTVSNLQGGQDDASKELLSICLQSAAKYAHINVNQLQNMPAGERRRGIVDDITVMVLQFE